MNFNAALASGKRASKTGSDAWVLRGEGKQHRVLVDSGGALTRWGSAYESHTGESLPRGKFGTAQSATREGNTESIALRGGGQGTVRTFDAQARAGGGTLPWAALTSLLSASSGWFACLRPSKEPTLEGLAMPDRVSSPSQTASSSR